MLRRLFDRWLRRSRIDRLTLMRKDKLTTGYVSEIYVDGQIAGYALENYNLYGLDVLTPVAVLAVNRYNVVCDEFTYPHTDNTLVLEPNSTLRDRLANTITVTIDSRYLPLEF